MSHQIVELEKIDLIELDKMTLLEVSLLFSEKLDDLGDDIDLYDNIYIDYCNIRDGRDVLRIVGERSDDGDDNMESLLRKQETLQNYFDCLNELFHEFGTLDPKRLNELKDEIDLKLRKKS